MLHLPLCMQHSYSMCPSLFHAMLCTKFLRVDTAQFRNYAQPMLHCVVNLLYYLLLVSIELVQKFASCHLSAKIFL